MTLRDILTQRAPAGSSFRLELPTRYGPLCLYLADAATEVLQHPVMSPTMLEDAREQLNQALAKQADGDLAGAEAGLLALARRYPIYAPAYGCLYELYWDSERPEPAEFMVKQLIALQPTPGNLLRLGRLLGRLGRLDEAEVVQQQVWEERAELTDDLPHEAAADLLITLGRKQAPDRMLRVIAEAVALLGERSTLQYQSVYAHVLAGRRDQARARLREVLPHIHPEDPLRPRFAQMEQFLAE